LTDRRAPVLPNIEVVAVDRWRPWWRREAQSAMFLVGCGYAIFGWSLLFQPTRWRATPAYANLLQFLPEVVWGIAYALAGVLLVVAVFRFPRRWTPVLPAMLLSSFLTGMWLFGFVLRYATSKDTTPFTWVAEVFTAYLLLRAWITLGDTPPTP